MSCVMLGAKCLRTACAEDHEQLRCRTILTVLIKPQGCQPGRPTSDLYSSVQSVPCHGATMNRARV